MEETIIKILTNLSSGGSPTASARLKEDLFLDSLALVMLLIETEKAFCITFDESDLDPTALITVSDVFSLVKKDIGTNDEA